jgi:hypothetical protein
MVKAYASPVKAYAYAEEALLRRWTLTNKAYFITIGVFLPK